MDRPQNSVLVPCVRECDESVASCWPFYPVISPQEFFGGICFTNGFFPLLLKIVNTLLKGTDLTHLQHHVNYKLDLYESTYFTDEGSVPQLPIS